MSRNHGSQFEKHKVAFEEGGGNDDALLEDEVVGQTRGTPESGSVDEKEKRESRVEQV